MGVVHGAGETLRGNIIGAVDSLLGGKHEAEATSLAQRGREEVHTGVDRMRGRSTGTRGTTGEGRPHEQEPTQQREPARPQEQAAEQQQAAGPQRRVQEPVQSKEQGQLQREMPPERVEEQRPVQQESSKPGFRKAEWGGEGQAGATDAPETIPATSLS